MATSKADRTPPGGTKKRPGTRSAANEAAAAETGGRPPRGRGGPAGAIKAVVGDDDGEVKRLAQEAAIQMAPAAAGEFGCETIDGVADTVDQAVERIGRTVDALLTLPFFGGEKLVWLKSATFLADTVTGRAEAVDEMLRRLGDVLESGLPPGVRFLLSAVEVDKRRTFYRCLTKAGEVRVCDRIDTGRAGWEEAATGAVLTQAKARRLRFAGEALEQFVRATAGDRREIEHALERIDLYLGDAGREVTLDVVRALTPETRETVVFELGNALARRDRAACYALLDRLLQQREDAVGILLAAIVPTVRNLLLVKGLIVRHRLRVPSSPFEFGRVLEQLPPAALEHLPRKKDGGINVFPLGFAAREAHRFTEHELRDLLGACLRANERLLTSAGSPRLILSELVAQLG